ncbi:ribbon-helix-helix protein, CopG family [Wenzhouxiangella marina]|uniref:Antitoxin n=1 Tax=Wenzhouxiangella marina TaxID=1579979 RepID=A0A0K0XZU8_9GAMM|nr:ribbon-helix-helix protein, CopG family [Wenzhouxiangella marina]AKS43198.1 antitoxin [Wenzhouxiangella marina]MBB6087116.1 plasmid stability protein [Wenzhouxiangella marina]
MRTTLTIDDELARQLKQRALDTGRSFKDVVNDALRDGLARTGAANPGRPYRIETARLGRTRPGIDLDKSLQLAGELEDEEVLRKLEQRK